MEPMYISTYRKHLIEAQLTIEEITRIAELDLEWEQFNKMKLAVKE